jgi:hypothetical protein
MNLNQGSIPIKMSSMPQSRAQWWMSQPKYPERSWRCGSNSLHRYPILSRIRLMPIIKPELGPLMSALGAASSSSHLPWWQRSTTWRWSECRKKTWRQTSTVPWSFRTNLKHFPLPYALVSTSCRQIFMMRIEKNTTTKDQSRRRHRKI